MKSRLHHRFPVLLAGFLLCLHTVVPHVHQLRLTAGQRIERCDVLLPVNGQWLGLLRGVIGADMGQGHLEHLSVDRAEATLPVAPAEALALARQLPEWPPFPPMAQRLLRLSPTSHPKWPPEGDYCRATPLRGPPFLA